MKCLVHTTDFGAEMFPRHQCSKPTFRKNAEHCVACSALNVICNILLVVCINIFKLRVRCIKGV